MSSLTQLLLLSFKTSRWIQAVFHLSDGTNFAVNSEAAIQAKENVVNKAENDVEVDISGDVVAEMFGVLPSSDNEVVLLSISYFFQKSSYHFFWSHLLLCRLNYLLLAAPNPLFYKILFSFSLKTLIFVSLCLFLSDNRHQAWRLQFQD